jgi:hypothetical protein
VQQDADAGQVRQVAEEAEDVHAGQRAAALAARRVAGVDGRSELGPALSCEERAGR